MRARLITGVFVLSALTVAAGQAPQPRPATPPFRADANYVRVDMFATDREQPVEDLTVNDVEVLEDGVRQSVVSFEHVAVRSGAEPPAASVGRGDAAVGNGATAAAPRSRVFVIFLDTRHTQLEGSSAMRLPLVRFLDRLLGPDDLVAVMTSEMKAADMALGRKPTVISNMMQSEWDWGRRGGGPAESDPKDALYQSCYPDSGDTSGIAEEMRNRRREALTLDALNDLVVHLDGLREERKAVITITDGWLLGAPSQNLARLAPANKKPSTPNPFANGRRDRPSGSTAGVVSMTECDADRNILASVDHRQRLRELTDRANRANVTFYPVYPRGLLTGNDASASDQAVAGAKDANKLSARQDSLRQLANETDGTSVITTGDVERGLARISNDLSSYYLLGYYSTNQKLDGRFRTIVVRTNRSGLRLRARRGYRAPTPEDLTGVTPTPTAAASVASAIGTVAAAAARTQLRLRAAAWPRESSDGVEGAVWVVGELDYKLRRDVAWTAGGAADVLLVSSSGKEVLSQVIDIDPTEGTFTLQIPETGGLPAGEYALRISVRSKQAGTSSLTETARVIVPGRPVALGEAVMWRRGPSTGPRFRMTADPRFQRSERVRLELASSTSGMPGARLLDQNGNTLAVPVVLSTRADESGEFRWVVAELSLAPLAPGSYGVEVGVEGAKVVTAFTVVP